jgi:hypothetical protein
MLPAIRLLQAAPKKGRRFAEVAREMASLPVLPDATELSPEELMFLRAQGVSTVDLASLVSKHNLKAHKKRRQGKPSRRPMGESLRKDLRVGEFRRQNLDMLRKQRKIEADQEATRKKEWQLKRKKARGENTALTEKMEKRNALRIKQLDTQNKAAVEDEAHKGKIQTEQRRR